MLALCVDDERLGLEALKRAVSLAPQVTGTAAFDNENDALLWAKDHRPDIAFYWHKDYACCIRILPSYSVQAMNITPSAP